MSRILVPGVNGFVGQNLVPELANHGFEVIGVGREAEPPASIRDELAGYTSCDLTNPEAVDALVLKGIDGVVNLAGSAINDPNERRGEGLTRLNVDVHRVLYERFLTLGLCPRIIAVSSGAIYDPDGPMPLTEDSPLIDLTNATPYVASKIALSAELDRLRRLGLEIREARPFNHTGKYQEDGFLIPDWAEKIILAKQSGKTPDTSFLDVWRIFLDIRDVTRAYRMLLQAHSLRHNTYNIAKVQPIDGFSLVGMLATDMDYAFENLGKVTSEQKIIGNHDRLSQDTGWQEEISEEQMIKDFAAWFLAK